MSYHKNDKGEKIIAAEIRPNEFLCADCYWKYDGHSHDDEGVGSYDGVIEYTEVDKEMLIARGATICGSCKAWGLDPALFYEGQ